MRLDPFQLIHATRWLSQAHYMLKGYGEAVRLCREWASRMPGLQFAHLWLAAAYAQSGRLQEARAEAAEVLRINPGFTIQGRKRSAPWKDPNDSEHVVDGLRKAGLPEAWPLAAFPLSGGYRSKTL